MRSKLMLSAIALTALFGATSLASAQNAPGSPPAVGPGTTDSKMMKPGTGTTGAGTGSQPASQPGMAKGGMKPDPSGQGGSGPGSDQGGTRVAPGNMK